MAFNYKTELERYRKYYQSVTPALEKPAGRAYTAIIFSFLVISLFGWYAIRPTMETIFTLQRQIKDKIVVDKQMEDKISALIEAQANYETVSAAIPLLTQALPLQADSVLGLRQLQFLAAENNVRFANVQVPPLPILGTTSADIPPTASNTLTNFTLSLTVLGAYADVKSFLNGVVNLRRMMQIDSVIFSSQRSQTIKTATGSATPTTTSTNVQVDLKLKIFYLST